MVTAREQDPRSGVQAVERVLRVLEAVAAAPQGLEAKDIAQIVGLSPSTAYRLAGVLQRSGYLVRRAPGRRYLLGRTVGELGVALQQQVIATPAVRAVLESVRDELRAPVYLTAFHHDEIVVAHIADSAERPRIGQLHVGFSEANHVTAFGKLMLASKQPGELDAVLGSLERAALTRHSVTSSAGLREQLAAIRREQVAVEVEEYMPKLACIAAPLRATGGAIIGAVSISLEAEDFRSNADRYARAVRRAAWHVSSRLLDP